MGRRSRPAHRVSNRFGLDWLRLRESHDLRARSRALGKRFGAMVRARAGDDAAALVDLGAGSGANFRALAPLIPGDQDWRLIDHDRDLLGHQAAEIAQWARGQGWRVTHGSGVVTVATGSAHWRAHSVALDLARDLPALPLRVHGITCSALLDLVSAPWLEQLADQLAAVRPPLLAALTVDGRRDWRPAHESDAALLKTLVRHQRRDKGFGPALGPDAPPVAMRVLRSHGYRVTEAPSDWHIDARDAATLDALIDGTAEAVAEADPDFPSEDWRRDRKRRLAEGGLSLLVGHVDILAVAEESPP